MGQSCDFLLSYWDMWRGIAKGVINNTTTDKASNKIASGLWSLMKEDVLK